MRQSQRRSWVLAIGIMLASASLALAADRPADEILKEIDASKMPRWIAPRSAIGATFRNTSRSATRRRCGTS